jgi:hypothetical protein
VKKIPVNSVERSTCSTRAPSETSFAIADFELQNFGSCVRQIGAVMLADFQLPIAD